MEIEAKVYKTEMAGMPTLKATASITIDKMIVIKGIRVIEGANGLFISMPNKKMKDGTYKDIAFPITKEARQKIVDAIMKEYNAYEQNTQDLISDDDLPF